ncbi:N-acyl-D-amino-acid deacylase family protein [Actinomarinicola tropica]|uniref:Amidohydrolase family protein n=1 Tax=Actinomarinicola tropica TaxID=2789776 RepID=A0A5Q2RIS7_9ACTN|nr:amidohydrolase family protein [Actinomarinicola tropica]QGG93740.1 amidohydrolase family protein [Actinomarinicola tropica]
MSELDLVIRGGTVVDGTGAPARTADVGVRDGRVVEVGRVAGRGAREVDADGALVAPGFVDIHAHYDGQATWSSRLDPSSEHGVTTVVMGNCGVGFAPVHDRDHDRLIELMEGVEDIPGAALHEGLSWEWRSMAEYLDAVDRLPHDIDVAAQVPHGALRLHVMGERGANREPATPEDIAEMGRIAAEGIRAGALGFTTSRTLNHRTSRGEPTPTLTAAADELVGIARAIGETGTGVLQIVSDFPRDSDELPMLREMVEASGRPLSISIAQSPVDPDRWRELLDFITESNHLGLPMTGQVAVRPVGLLFGLDNTLHPFLSNPVFQQELAGLTAAETARAMRDPAVRERALAAQRAETERARLGGRLLARFDQMWEVTDPPVYEPDPATSLAARAAADGVLPEELAYDLLAEGDGRAMFYVPFLNYAHGNLDVVGEMLRHDHTVPGLADGGAHVGTICDGSFPTTLLEWWGRDRPSGRIPLEELIRRQCRDTARTVGLLDRGVLAPGYRADVNVIDHDNLRLHRPEAVHDLPAGGRRLLQRAEGYLHTFVAGEETFTAGESTGALPGRLVRGAQPAPA